MKLSIRRTIIEKMVKHRIWGGKHASVENVSKGFPPHLKREVLDEIKSLIKEGIIISKPTSYGLQISLNPRMKATIEEIIRSSL